MSWITWSQGIRVQRSFELSTIQTYLSQSSSLLITFSLLQSLMVHKVPIHQIVAEHDLSRSYQPSMTGIAAYYQAEQSGGLAVCPPPLPRVPSNHHLHGESPAEEVSGAVLFPKSGPRAVSRFRGTLSIS